MPINPLIYANIIVLIPHLHRTYPEKQENEFTGP